MSSKKIYSRDPESLISNQDWEWFGQQTFKPDQPKSAWHQLFTQFFQFGPSNQATQKWLRATQPLIEAVGKDTFTQKIPALVEFYKSDKEWFKGKKAELIKGLIWAASLYPNETNLRAIGQLIEKAFTKIPGKGALATKVGNTGINALVTLKNTEAMMILVQMKTRTKYAVFIKSLDKGIQKLTLVTGLSESDIQDRMTPEFGLKDRSLVDTFGDYQAQSYLLSYNKILTEWLKPDGKVQKSEPAQVKRDYRLELQGFKDTLQDIKKTLQTQRYRLEESWRHRRRWKYATWKKYIFDHELIKILSHTLIWEFEQAGEKVWGIAPEGILIDQAGNPLKDLEDSEVELWHPVQASVEEVLAWRNFMFTHQIKQAFKQAFREVYVVTDAELATKTYSNRFSAHILEQRKLWALTQQRDWKYKGATGFQYNTPELSLPAYQLKASLDLSFSMFEYDYATTQRVKFISMANTQERALANINPVAFSEVMRDIDLFIAVCSIGNDPNWDGTDDYKDYWYDYAYGEKSDTVSAKNRKELLMRIIPQTKIADKSSFEGNFLVVQGQIRAYKINIGSANILMQPHDEYLCIVPDRKSKTEGGKIFLPVEGDTILSLILSKAFLLAEDDKITDQVILNQIHRA